MESNCTSQLQQIGKATQMYMDDYNDRPPLRIHDLYPIYVTDKRLFTCRRDEWLSQGGWAWSMGKYNTPPEIWPFPISYGYFFAGDPFSGGPGPEGQWGELKSQPGRPGYLVCVLHGESLDGGLMPGDAPYFRGRTLRLCFDGSVVGRDLRGRDRFNVWLLLTDQEKRPGAP